MAILILGVALWIAAHLFGRVAPEMRARLGAGGKFVIGAVVLVAIYLMHKGYGGDWGTFHWGRSPMLTGINNLLVLIAVYLFAAAGMNTWAGRTIPHPMQVGIILWAVAHLLVNGDTPSFILFGGMILWALLHIAVVGGKGERYGLPARPAKFELFAALGTVLVFGLAAMVHKMLGYPVFG